MKAEWIFFKCNWKKYGKTVPVILAESILFGLILLSFGIFATKAVYGEKSIGQIKVGIVSNEESALTGMLVKFIRGMDSMENASFTIMEEKEAYEALEKGSIYAAVIVPEGMIEGILNGNNIPVKVVFSTAFSQMETEVFREMVNAEGRLLSTAQAGIYAADELCRELGEKEKIRESEEYLNEAYLEYALNRTAVFKKQEINAAGKVNLKQYYGAALILIFLSFAGMMLGRSFRIRSDSFSEIMKAGGISEGKQYLLDTAAYMMVFALLGMLFACPLLWVAFLKGTENIPQITEILVLFLEFLSLGSFIKMTIELTGNKAGGLGASFFLLTVLMFGAGLFLPPSFLPLWLEKTGNFSPYKFWLEGIFTVMQKGEIMKTTAILVLLMAVSMAAGMGVYLLKSTSGNKN